MANLALIDERCPVCSCTPGMCCCFDTTAAEGEARYHAAKSQTLAPVAINWPAVRAQALVWTLKVVGVAVAGIYGLILLSAFFGGTQ